MPKYLDQFGDGVRQVIRAYHGSPYDFDRFDASKIGTGEGAQVYGHGLYFAGNEDVAQAYRTKLSGTYSQNLADAADLPSYFAPGNIVLGYGGRDKVLRFVQPEDRPWDWAVEVVRVDASGQPLIGERPRIHRTHPRAMDVDSFFGRAPRRPGHTYEVEIGYPEEALLDYDRPFATPAGVVGAEILRQDNPAAVSASALRAIQDGSWRMESFVGRSPYETAAVELTRLAKTRGGAQALMDAGVPGVRYLDGQSRGAGEGTRNYVMFPGTEDSIRILRKYGLLAPIPAAMAGSSED